MHAASPHGCPRSLRVDTLWTAKESLEHSLQRYLAVWATAQHQNCSWQPTRSAIFSERAVHTRSRRHLVSHRSLSTHSWSLDSRRLQLGLRPTGLAEIWYVPPSRRCADMDSIRSAGRISRTGGARTQLAHGSFHPACKERCEPIMGFLLCGLADCADA